MTLRAANFREPPLIAPNYLSTEQDIHDVANGGRLLQAIARTRAMSKLILEPLDADLRAMTDEALVNDFRARAATVYHPVGTCRMGPSASDSVVDPTLRVRGVSHLRIVDASVFPTITSANVNAPTLMVAQRAAEFILNGTWST